MAAALRRSILGHMRLPVSRPLAAGSKNLQSLLFRPFSCHGDEHVTKEQVTDRVDPSKVLSRICVENCGQIDVDLHQGNKVGHDWASVQGYGVPSFTFSRSARLGAPHRDAVSGFSPRRCFTTAANPVESESDDTTVPQTDVPTRIKFKRLDKTARHIMQILDKEAVEEVRAHREIPDIKPGYIIQLKLEVPENKRRITTIKGIVIARRNAGLNTTFRIRRLVAGVGVESLLPLYSPNIKEIKVLDKKKVRRAKLYYLREKMNPLKK